MEHTDALKTNAVERYLLGEMADEERDIFEEHYFDCAACAAEVTAGTHLMVAGRDVAKESANVVEMKRGGTLRYPLAAAASLIFGLLGAAGGYQYARMQPRHEDPTRIVRTVSIPLSETRAAAPDTPIEKVRSGDVLLLEIPNDELATQYVATVRCGDKVQSQEVISREEAAETVPLQLGELPAARCDLAIQSVRKDGNRSELAGNSFEVVE